MGNYAYNLVIKWLNGFTYLPVAPEVLGLNLEKIYKYFGWEDTEH